MKGDSSSMARSGRSASAVAPREIEITIGGSQVALVAAAAALVALTVLVSSGRLPLPVVPELDHTTALWLVALTGLSVGGLSCLAVQGGLLAAVIAREEADGELTPIKRSIPVLQFLAAKTIAYAALGALLGYFGSLIPVSMQGWLMIAAGVFMIVMVLQMFDVHPIFRRFTVTPPKNVQRSMRGSSKSGGRYAPLAVGAATVFIPCGVTLAMEALAIASDSPVRGALIMTAFTLGTAPLFLGLGLMATQLRGVSGRAFKPAAAILVVVIAATTMLSGARLLGLGTALVSGDSITATAVRVGQGGDGALVGPKGAAAADVGAGNSGAGTAFGGGSSAAGVDGGAGAVAGSHPGNGASEGGPMTVAGQEATINVVTGAYEPPIVRVTAGVPTKLHLTSHNAQGCIRAFVIPSLGIEALLPASGTVTVDVPALEPGRVGFSCSMGMYSGVIEVVG